MRRSINLLAVVASLAFSTACNNSGSTNTSNQKLTVVADNAIVKYQCPMKCQGDTAYTTAGQCPVCEMGLEKISNEQNK